MNPSSPSRRAADELLDKLRIEYNKARQASITQEITEVVAGAGNAK